MIDFHRTDLPGRAAVLGISCRELLTLGELDRRNVASPTLATEGSVRRLRRWLEAGLPSADLARLEFTGDDEVRSLVSDVLSSLPPPVAWHGIEHIVWLEVGRGTAAWTALAPPMPAPRGDQPHVVLINGRGADDDLRGVIAHELGHSWHRAIFETAPSLSALPEREAIAARVLFARYTGISDPAADAERWVRARVANELLADRTAEAWGIRHHGPCELELRRHFGSAYAAAAALVAERDQSENTDHVGADFADRAAAIEGAP